MNILFHGPFSGDYNDIETISSFLGESGTRIAQSDATIVATNHSFGTKPMALISTVERQNKVVNSKNDGSAVPRLYDAGITESLFEEINSCWNQQREQQLPSDFRPPMNCDYSGSNTTDVYDNINNSYMWTKEQFNNSVALNNKNSSYGSHEQTLSSAKCNLREQYHPTTFTTETVDYGKLLYSNSSISSNNKNSNSLPQQRQVIVDISSLSINSSSEWEFLRQHDWEQRLGINNNGRNSSSSSSSPSLNHPLYYPYHDIEYQLPPSPGESSTSQQGSGTESCNSYPLSSETSSSSSASLSSLLQQWSTTHVQQNPTPMLLAADTSRRGTDSICSKNNSNDSIHCFSEKRSQASSTSSTGSIQRSSKKDFYVCFFDTCRDAIRRRSDLPRHIRSKHDRLNEKTQYQCNMCRKIILGVRRDLIKRHVNSGCSNKKKKKLSSRRYHHPTVRAGEDNHGGYTIIRKPNSYCCCFPKCDKTFSSDTAYENHILTHDTVNKKSGITGYCDSCGEIKCYTRIQALEQHFKSCGKK